MESRFGDRPHSGSRLFSLSNITLFWLIVILPSAYGINPKYESVYPLITYAFIAILLIGSIGSRKGYGTLIKPADLIVPVFGIYGILNYLFKTPYPDYEIPLNIIGGIIIFFSMRTFAGKPPAKISPVFGIAVLVQSSWVMLQYFGLSGSLHPSFAVTGSFHNPGPLGGFLGITLSVFSIFCLTSIRGKWIWICLPVGVLGSAALVLSNSRAGWLCFLVPVALFLINQIINRKTKLIAGIIFCALAGALLFGLYTYKKDSADGRIFIWQRSMEAFCEKPITGHGAGSFPAVYMEFQARYFDSDPESDAIRLASDNTYAFNDFILCLVEQGIIGFILLVGLTFIALTTKSNSRNVTVAKYGLLSLLIFSLFSYPSDVLALRVFYPLFFGLLPGNVIGSRRVRLSRGIRTVIIIFSAGSILTTGFYACSLIRAEKYLNRYYKMAEYSSIPKIERLYRFIGNNRSFNLKYARVMFITRDFERALPPMEKSARMVPSSQLLCDLATVYAKLGRYGEAEAILIRTARMVPGFIMPKYRLYLLYDRIGEYEKKLTVAKQISSMQVKVNSANSRKIKAEIEEFITTQ